MPTVTSTHLGDTAFDPSFFKLVVRSLSIDNLYLNGDDVGMVVLDSEIESAVSSPLYVRNTLLRGYRPKSEELTPVYAVYTRRVT